MAVRSAGNRTFGISFRIFGLLAGAWLAISPCGAQSQAPVYDEVHTLAAATVAVPQEFDFSVTAAGTYTVTLTDLGAALTPSAPLATVKLAVTGNDALVGSPLVGAGSTAVSLPAAGSYRLHVIGTPGAGLGSGPFGVVVSHGATAIANFQGTLALPASGLPNGEALIDGSFTVSTTGSYTVALNDLQLPQSLGTLTLLLIAQGSASPVVILPQSGSLQASVSLTAGVTYDVFAVGQVGAASTGGLYSAVVTTGGGGPVVFFRTAPVGTTISVGTPSLPAGSDTLVLTDLKYPAALAQVGAVLTLTGQPVAQLSAPGSQPFTATAANYEAFAYGGAAAAAPGAGSFAVQVVPGSGSALFGAARGVTASGSALTAFGFDATIPNAGSYSVSATDFQFPSALGSLGVLAVQGGAQVGQPLTATGSFNANMTAGPASLVVFTQAAAAGGLFGVEVAPASGAPVFDATQGVGALFAAQKLSITAAGTYGVTATDLGFPASFAAYDTIVTQGTTHLGSIYGGGTFTFTATAGNYYINFLAQPAGSDQAGTYALQVAAVPPAPAVTLSVDHPTVSSGATVDVIWSSENATSCTASGGWSGTLPPSGSRTSSALTANTTFSLSCTGPGGTTSKTVSVTVTSSSGGGGGRFDALSLALLGGVLLAQLMRRRGAKTSSH